MSYDVIHIHFFFLILKCRPFPGIHKFLGSVVKHWLSTDCPGEFLKSKDPVVYFIIIESRELEGQRLTGFKEEKLILIQHEN